MELIELVLAGVDDATGMQGRALTFDEKEDYADIDDSKSCEQGSLSFACACRVMGTRCESGLKVYFDAASLAFLLVIVGKEKLLRTS